MQSPNSPSSPRVLTADFFIHLTSISKTSQISAVMAENNLPPNFDNITSATADLVTSATVLSTKLSRIRNLQGIEGTQGILDRLDRITTGVQRIETRIQRIESRQIKTENSLRRLWNS